MTPEDYGLDLHCTMMLEEYREMVPTFNRLKGYVLDKLKECLDKSGVIVSGVEARVKQEKSLAGKLELKKVPETSPPRCLACAPANPTGSEP